MESVFVSHCNKYHIQTFNAYFKFIWQSAKVEEGKKSFVVTPTFYEASNIFGNKKQAHYNYLMWLLRCCNSDDSVMLILTHNFKFNIQHHLVVVDDTVGGGRIFCDGSVYVVMCLK